MLTLYYKPTCPFCQKVFTATEDMNLDMELKNIVEDEQAAAELEDLGGKRQVPFLLDTDTQKMMYESDDIIAYLKENYSEPAKENIANNVRVHRANTNTCVACEG